MHSFLVALASVLLAPASAAPAAGRAAADTTLDVGKFGQVTIYRGTAHPSHVALFLSGDGGWNLGVVDMGRALADLDCLVVGVDVNRYVASIRASGEPCARFWVDLETLGRSVQQRLGFPDHVAPVLVGYSSGATIAYAAAVEARPGTFLGAMSLGFAPDLPAGILPCRGRGLELDPGPPGRGARLRPAADLATPWIAFQGEEDRVCNADSTRAFVAKTGKRAAMVLLPKVGHGFSVQSNWMPEFRGSFARLAAASLPAPVDPSVRDLPLVEVPVSTASPPPDTRGVFTVILSGDGGWASLDRAVGEELAARGVPVVGWSSLHYFWTEKTPAEASDDLARVVRAYRKDWNRDKVILVGYSLGADVLPFMARRLPDDVRRDVEAVVLIGPGRRTQFRFRVTDWLHLSPATTLPVLPEAKGLDAPVLLCFQGDSEKRSLCPELQGSAFRIVTLPGGHHFDGDYRAIADRILSETLK